MMQLHCKYPGLTTDDAQAMIYRCTIFVRDDIIHPGIILDNRYYIYVENNDYTLHPNPDGVVYQTYPQKEEPKQMKSLKIVMDLLNRQEDYKDAINHLENMKGKSCDKEPKVKCHTVGFESDYTTNLNWYGSYDDGELNILLVDTAIQHIKGKLQSLELLLGLADMALERALKTDGKQTEEV